MRKEKLKVPTMVVVVVGAGMRKIHNSSMSVRVVRTGDKTLQNGETTMKQNVGPTYTLH